MSYQDMNDLYRGGDRGRYEAAIAEQAHTTYAASDDPASAALADSVIQGDLQATDSLIRAITVGPNSAALGEDPDLLAAVQAAWAGTAAAWYEEAS